MATSLRDNLTSAYLDAAHRMKSKKARRRIVAYVESYDDVAFWRTLLSEFEDDEQHPANMERHYILNRYFIS